MNIIYNILYPKPKLNWDPLKFKDDIIYIPIFKSKNYYNLYKKEYIWDKENDKKKKKQYNFTKMNNNYFNISNRDLNLLLKKNPKAWNHKNDDRAEKKIWKNLMNSFSKLKKDFNKFSKPNIHRSTSLNDIKEENKNKIKIKPNNDSLNKKLLKNNFIKEIPCLYLKREKCNNILIYFHANNEDIGITKYLLSQIRDYIQINVLCIEYPNYSIYKSKDSINQNLIYEDAKNIIDFLNICLDINFNDMIICGRSIGSAPTCYLSSIYKFGFCFLITPFISIRKIIKDFSYIGNIGKLIIKKNILNNLNFIKKTKNKFLIVHGDNDDLINHKQSEILCNSIKDQFCQLYIFEGVNHNDFDPITFILNPLKNFMNKINFNLIYEEEKKNYINKIRNHKKINIFN